MKRLMMPAVSLSALAAVRPVGVMGNPRADGAPGDLERLLKDVQQQMERIEGGVKQTAEDALKQTRDQGRTTDELKAKADELLTSQKALNDAQQKLIGRLEQLETRNTEVEQQLAERGGRGGDAQQSVGQRFATSDEVKAFTSAGCKGTARMSLNVRQAITSITGSAGALIWSDREAEIVGLPRRQMTVRQLLTQGRTTSNSIEYAKQITRTNNAGMVSEGAQKPESVYEWASADANVRTIAHWVPVSRQAMEDAAQLETEIDGELRYGLLLKEELQLLSGDGTGQNLSGLKTEATDYAAAFMVAGETMIDQLRLALLQASLSDYPADGIVLHPTDWARIELTKDGEQRYIFANVMQMSGPQLWGQPVVATPSMDADEFLVGAFKMAATIYDRMDPEVIASSEDRDNFIKNMITVRAEERLALAIKRSAALITGDFGNVSG
ncbi:phage major capsid protein [Salipiger sp. H15]|uniref:Phage major capsid protein n=1 Tax=Alloyangia sp. H15 TaxID=3029062 RepID=A0AAU8ANN0_9RHOB